LEGNHATQGAGDAAMDALCPYHAAPAVHHQVYKAPLCPAILCRNLRRPRPSPLPTAARSG
jgi:hypothetical protein